MEDAIATTQVRQGSGDAFVSTSVWDGTTNYTGWSFGSDQRSSADVNFRITNNVFSVSNTLTTALFISGADSNVGIGTDSTPAKLTVSGSVRVGDKLQFKGTTASGTDSDDKIFFQEREIGNTGRTELLVYKGNDADTSSDAVDRIGQSLANTLGKSTIEARTRRRLEVFPNPNRHKSSKMRTSRGSSPPNRSCE